MEDDETVKGVSPRYEGLTSDQLVGFLRLDVGVLPLAQQVALTWEVERLINAATQREPEPSP